MCRVYDSDSQKVEFALGGTSNLTMNRTLYNSATSRFTITPAPFRFLQ